MCLGGFIFMHLEQTNEKQECINARDQYLPAENDTINKLWMICKTFTNDDEMIYAMIELQKVLRIFRDNVVSIGWDSEKDCDLMGEENGPAYNWNLAGSILFSVTVFTTIGKITTCIRIISQNTLHIFDSSQSSPHPKKISLHAHLFSRFTNDESK